MKKKTLTLALFAVLSALATSCQKENLKVLATGETIEQPYTGISLSYMIDEQQYSATFSSLEEKEAFVIQLMALARQGHKVTIKSNRTTATLAKEKKTYETTDPEDAAKWALIMGGYGYTVTIYYNEETGIYTCVAIK